MKVNGKNGILQINALCVAGVYKLKVGCLQKTDMY